MECDAVPRSNEDETEGGAAVVLSDAVNGSVVDGRFRGLEKRSVSEGPVWSAQYASHDSVARDRWSAEKCDSLCMHCLLASAAYHLAHVEASASLVAAKPCFLGWACCYRGKSLGRFRESHVDIDVMSLSLCLSCR